jgi:hypothetical protein
MDNGPCPGGLKGFFNRGAVWFKKNKWARTSLTAALIVVPIAFLLRNLFINWQSLQDAAIEFNWARMLLSLLILLLSFAVLPLGTIFSLQSFGFTLDFRNAYYAYHASQLGKYLPGRIWIIPGRAVLIKNFGMDPFLGGMGALLETYLLIVTGILSFLPYLLLVPNATIRQVAVIGVLLCLPAILILFFPKILNRVLSVLLKWFNRPAFNITFSWKQILRILITYVLFWQLSGAGFYLLCSSVYALNGRFFFQISGVMGFSWVIGFLSFLTPAGIGVREGAIGFLLTPLLPEPFPALAAILSRVWWSLADLLSIGMAFLLFRTKRN